MDLLLAGKFLLTTVMNEALKTTFLLGFDDSNLTHFHVSRFKQLPQTDGEVIKELIA